MHDSTPSRRHVVALLAGAAAAVAGLHPARAGEARIARLIGASRDLTFVGERIDAISLALLGTPYVAYPLIGGPRKPEEFVVRDDGFDCVTFCETVLAAARSFAAGDFVAQLRKIRYHDGRVEWRERNHYFADWSLYNIANGVCRSVVLPGAAVVEKTVSYMRGLPPERVTLARIPTASLFAHADRLATGDIIGFLSQRPAIDFFHTGFIIVDRDGVLWLRHAARSKGRVLDQRLVQFIAGNRVRHVTLLRPQELWTGETIA
jgi:hypothetical protein